MKKTWIPAGALLLAMACHSSSRDEAAPAKAIVADVEFKEPPEPPPTSLADLDANGEKIGQLNTYALNVSDQNSGYSDDGTSSPALTAMAPPTNKPEVGKAISSSAARTGTDTSFRFIRTAELSFRVKDVVKATLGIEDIVGAHRGWVVHTTLKSEPQGTEVIPVSADSSLEISRYSLRNNITLRVPNAELDSTIRQIGRWVDLFDHRTIDADDIRLRMLANTMAERRAKTHAARIAQAIDAQGRRLKETMPAEEALQQAEERRDQSILDNKELDDRVAYSTVRMEISQRTLVRRELIANAHNIEGYRPSLFSRIGGALLSGWRLLEMVITGLISIWPVVLLLGGSLFWLWRGSKRRKERTPAPPAQGAQ